MCQTEIVWGLLEASYPYIVSGCGARAAASADSYQKLRCYSVIATWCVILASLIHLMLLALHARQANFVRVHLRDPALTTLTDPNVAFLGSCSMLASLCVMKLSVDPGSSITCLELLLLLPGKLTGFV